MTTRSMTTRSMTRSMTTNKMNTEFECEYCNGKILRKILRRIGYPDEDYMDGDLITVCDDCGTLQLYMGTEEEAIKKGIELWFDDLEDECEDEYECEDECEREDECEYCNANLENAKIWRKVGKTDKEFKDGDLITVCEDCGTLELYMGTEEEAIKKGIEIWYDELEDECEDECECEECEYQDEEYSNKIWNAINK